MANLEEQDFDEKRLARRQRRKQSQLIAYIILFTCFLLFIGVIVGSVFLIKGVVGNKAPEQVVSEEAAAAEEESTAAVIETPEAVQEQEEYTEEDMLSEIIETVISEMTVEDKVAGLFIVTPEQLTGASNVVKAGSSTQEALTNYAVGGIVYSPKNIKSSDQILEMMNTTSSMSKYPLFTVLSDQSVYSDSVKEVLGITSGTEITDEESAYTAGSELGTALFKYGFNFVMAPNMDITENGQFGTDIDTAKELSTSYAQGIMESGVTPCAYSFPLSLEESLEGMASIDTSRDDLVINQFEVFKGAIDADTIGAVMVSNISASSLTGDNTPLSMSDVAIEGELRGTLGFGKVIISAPLDEGAITEYYTPSEAAVTAIKSGADMLYIPSDFQQAYDGLLSAVQSQDISEDRINESLRRIYRLKYRDKVDDIVQGN